MYFCVFDIVRKEDFVAITIELIVLPSITKYENYEINTT